MKKDTNIYVLQRFGVAVGHALVSDSLRQLVSLYDNCEQRVILYDSLLIVKNRIIKNTGVISDSYRAAYEKEKDAHAKTRFWGVVKDISWGAGLLTVLVILL